MSTAGTVLTGWQKSNVHIVLNATSISTAPTGTATYSIPNVGNGPWPRQNKPIRELGYQSTGGTNSMRILSDYQVASVQRPSFTLDLPFTPTMLALAAVAVMQQRTTATADIKVYPFTDPQASKFFGFETTYGANAGRTVTGAIGKTLKISVPSAGADGGMPTLSLDCLAYSTAQMDALTVTPATLHTTALCQSTDWNVAVGTVGAAASAIGFCGFDLTVDNGAEVDPQVSANPAAFELGELTMKGTLKAVMSTTAGDEYNTILDNFLAGTPNKLQFNWGVAGATAYLQMPVLWDEPSEPQKQGNVMVFDAPFRAYYRDADEPEFMFVGMATPLTIWA